MFVTSMDGLSGKLPIAGLRSKIFAQEVPRLKLWADAGLCPVLPVYIGHMYRTYMHIYTAAIPCLGISKNYRRGAFRDFLNVLLTRQQPP